MNREKILRILQDLDDSNRFEAPDDFDYSESCHRIECFVNRLQEVGIDLTNVYLQINDSTHFAEAHLSGNSVLDSAQGGLVKFSLFGGLVFIECPSSNLKEGVLELITEVAESLTLSLIPFGVGEELYDGRHHCRQWRERFFEYY